MYGVPNNGRRNNMEERNVIIIGAGPAGLSAAMKLKSKIKSI